MFPLAFPLTILRRASAEDWVLDPFCGRGTTLYAARLLGLPCVGVDSNPVAAAIASAKLCHVTPDDVATLAERLLVTSDPNVVRPTGDFWEGCFHPDTLAELCKLRARLLQRCSTQTEVALRAVLLGILHGPVNKGLPTYLSNQMPRTYATKPNPAVNYWRKRGLVPMRVGTLDATRRRAAFTFARLPAPVAGRVFQADSRRLRLPRRRRFRWVITSPPYYGMRTYFPDQWLRNWFVGGPDTVSYAVADQLPHSGEEAFVVGLAAVWQRTAAVCEAGATLAVRFGTLPSVSKDPRGMLLRSLREADAGWRVTTIRNAGTAQQGKRQYEQFGASKSDPIEEIDLYAKLET
jgi:hypothetical protein